MPMNRFARVATRRQLGSDCDQIRPHQPRTQRARQNISGKGVSVDLTKRSKSEVATGQISNNVRLRANTESYQ